MKKKKKRKKLSSECSLKSQHSETSPTNAAVIKPIQDVDENGKNQILITIFVWNLNIDLRININSIFMSNSYQLGFI